MGKYKLIVRCQVLMGRPVTDIDRKALNCYYETPTFYANSNCEAVEIICEAFEQLCAGNSELRCVESVELIDIA